MSPLTAEHVHVNCALIRFCLTCLRTERDVCFWIVSLGLGWEPSVLLHG